MCWNRLVNSAVRCWQHGPRALRRAFQSSPQKQPFLCMVWTRYKEGLSKPLCVSGKCGPVPSPEWSVCAAQANVFIHFPSAPRERFWSPWSDYLVSGSGEGGGSRWESTKTDALAFFHLLCPFQAWTESEPVRGRAKLLLGKATLPGPQELREWSAWAVLFALTLRSKLGSSTACITRPAASLPGSLATPALPF